MQTVTGSSAENAPDPPSEHTSDPAGEVLERLARRFPEHATAIVDSGRLRAAVDALVSALALDAATAEQLLGERGLHDAQRPLDLLTSRCMHAIRDHTAAGSAVEGALPSRSTALADGDEPRQRRSEPGTAAPPVVPVPRAGTSGRWRGGLRVRSRVSIAAPIVHTPDLRRIVAPITGNRYIAVAGACGGAGATTVTVLVGSILSSCRPDRVAATEATATPRALADRAGQADARSVRGLVADGAHIDGCVDVSRVVGRAPSRLDVAALAHHDEPLSADEYRRSTAVLSRFYDIVVSDVGAGTLTPAAAPSIDLADLVVVVTSPTDHGWRSAARRMEIVTDTGVATDRIVVVVNGIHRRNPVNLPSMLASLRAHSAGVATLPWDAHLAAGNQIGLASVHRLTLAAASNLTASIVDGLLERRE